MGRLSGLADRVRLARVRIRKGPEEDRATAYWASLPDYHEQNDRDPVGLAQEPLARRGTRPGAGHRLVARGRHQQRPQPRGP